MLNYYSLHKDVVNIIDRIVWKWKLNAIHEQLIQRIKNNFNHLYYIYENVPGFDLGGYFSFINGVMYKSNMMGTYVRSKDAYFNVRNVLSWKIEKVNIEYDYEQTRFENMNKVFIKSRLRRKKHIK